MKDHHQAWKWAVGVAGALTIALAANFAWAAKPDGPKCTYQNMIELGKGFEELAPPSSEFAFCSKTPVIGTLNGNDVACLLFDPAGDFFDLGWSLFTLGPLASDYSAYWKGWIETPEGRLALYSIGVADFDKGLQAILRRVAPGSTGKFEGATGVFSYVPDWETYNPASTDPSLGNFRITGYLCTP